jgi:hypothetical protein
VTDTTLNWIRQADGTVLDGVTVQNGKLVILRESWNAVSGAPGEFHVYEFHVYRSHGAVLDAILWQTGMRYLKIRIATLPARQVYGPRSEAGPWPITASGIGNQSRLFFADDRGYSSKSLTVTSETFGADWVEHNLSVIGLVPPIRAGASTKRRRLRYRIKGLKDPDLTIRLVTPWGDDPRYPDGSTLLRTMLVEDFEQREDIEEVISSLASLGLLRSSPPERWSQRIADSELRVNEGEATFGWVDVESGEPADILVALRVELSTDPAHYVLTPFTVLSFRE